MAQEVWTGALWESGTTVDVPKVSRRRKCVPGPGVVGSRAAGHAFVLAAEWRRVRRALPVSRRSGRSHQLIPISGRPGSLGAAEAAAPARLPYFAHGEFPAGALAPGLATGFSGPQIEMIL